MPEVPNAYRCDYCHTLMEPIEAKTERWHTKWCSACGVKLYDVFIGREEQEERYECPNCKAGYSCSSLF